MYYQLENVLPPISEG